MVHYCAVHSPLALLPEPDPSLAARAEIDATVPLAILAELPGWAKVETRSPDMQAVQGWVPRSKLKELRASAPKVFTLFTEPMGEAGKPAEGRVHKRLVDLGSWIKVALRGGDGKTRSGWVRSADLPPAKPPKTSGPRPVEPQPRTVPAGPPGSLALGVNEIYRDALLEAQVRTGIDAAALAAMVDAEASIIRSGAEKGQWNPRAFNRKSGAAGLTQFVRSTWLDHARQSGTALREDAAKAGLVDGNGQIQPGQEAALLELRFDSRLSILSAAEYGAANLKGLIRRNLVDESAPDDRKGWFMYLAHHEGLSGAVGFLDQSRVYTSANLELQVGPERRDALIAQHGDANRGYRNWLKGYIDEKIRPDRFRRPATTPASPAGTGGFSARPTGDPSPTLASNAATISAYRTLEETQRARLESWAGPALPFDGLGPQVPLVLAIQQALSLHGYLDPPADGKFGPVSLWALHEFARRNGFAPGAGFTPDLARALADPARALPARRESGQWIDAILVAMERNTMFLCRHPACCNIVYIEGMGIDGRANDDRPNRFNDVRIVVRFDDTGLPSFESWDATTEPGDFWTFNPMNPAGAARIAFGQYKSWVVGRHLAGRPSGHEALVQAEPIVVHRDFNKDHQRMGDATDRGLFGVNQHWGYDADPNDIKNTSAGCLVGRTREGHRAFMARVKGDARFKVSKGYRFVTAILPADQI